MSLAPARKIHVGPPGVKPPVSPSSFEYRELREDPFWHSVPAFASVSEEQFFDHRWQAKNSITKLSKLLEALQGVVSDAFLQDAAAGFAHAPMSVRVSPYLLSLIDWKNPVEDPLRRQFIPLFSQRLPDHPQLQFDSLHEQADAPVPGLTHRYVDKALFLPLDTCPVYCRFCTRSYAVGPDSEQVEKVSLKVDAQRWTQAFDYIASRPELEDIVISGGDAYNLRAEQIRLIGEALLGIEHVRRLRFATKGLAVMPQKILSDHEWFDALRHVVTAGRLLHKAVFVHTHFNHPNEITYITRMALNKLFGEGITVRNQTVLQRGVNDSPATMKLLVKRLGHLNVQPYYVYMHDLVKGVEDLRTTVGTAMNLEKEVRGTTAGFNTPSFVVDAPGGGGKRDIHSAEYYDRRTGISVYVAPAVKPGRPFLYFDPIHLLPEDAQEGWKDSAASRRMIDDAIERARSEMLPP